MKFKKTFQLIIDFFEKQNIDYALIGAFALKAYGYTRATLDVDFIAERKDRKKIVAYLESLGFETLYSSAGYTNHAHSLSGLGRIDFVYVKGKTAETVFKEAVRIPLFGNLTMPVVKPEHLAALKIFAMKNDPDRILREMADIKELLKLEGIDLREIQKYFAKYGLMEKYHEIIGKTPKKQ